MLNGPTLWNPILRAVRAQFGGDAVIAGGCIRDFMLDVPFKDIDIFVNVRGPTDLGRKMRSLNKEALDGVQFDLDFLDAMNELPASEYSQHQNLMHERKLFGVLDGRVAVGHNDYAVNIIARPILAEGATRLIEGFDMGIVQAYYDGQEIRKTVAFVQDWRARTATLMFEEVAHISRERFARFDRRNPGLLKLNDPFPGEDNLFD